MKSCANCEKYGEDEDGPNCGWTTDGSPCSHFEKKIICGNCTSFNGGHCIERDLITGSDVRGCRGFRPTGEKSHG